MTDATKKANCLLNVLVHIYSSTIYSKKYAAVKNKNDEEFLQAINCCWSFIFLKECLLIMSGFRESLFEDKEMKQVPRMAF